MEKDTGCGGGALAAQGTNMMEMLRIAASTTRPASTVETRLRVEPISSRALSWQKVLQLTIGMACEREVEGCTNSPHQRVNISS
jgi:hypothetical protein